jgi:hypothetical protein
MSSNYYNYIDVNSQISTTSPDTFEPQQKKVLNEQKNIETMKTGMLLFNFFRIIIVLMFMYIILTSEKYETLYESDTNTIFVSLNLLLAYIHIGVMLFVLFAYKDKMNSLFKNDTTRPIFIVFLFLYLIYIISTIQLTYILLNFDDYRDKDYNFFTYYYTLVQFITIIITLATLK